MDIIKLILILSTLSKMDNHWSLLIKHVSFHLRVVSASKESVRK